ncbi:MAG: SOS response-associated peptidase family protein [Terracidiphilus sp.]
MRRFVTGEITLVLCADDALNSETGERELTIIRWGLIPFWLKDSKIDFSTINANVETVTVTTSPGSAYGQILQSDFDLRQCGSAGERLSNATKALTPG